MKTHTHTHKQTNTEVCIGMICNELTGITNSLNIMYVDTGIKLRCIALTGVYSSDTGTPERSSVRLELTVAVVCLSDSGDGECWELGEE